MTLASTLSKQCGLKVAATTEFTGVCDDAFQQTVGLEVLEMRNTLNCYVSCLSERTKSKMISISVALSPTGCRV